MDSHLAHYVVSNFSQLMTARERLAHRHLIGTIKATHGRSDTAAQVEAKTNKTLSKLLSDAR